MKKLFFLILLHSGTNILKILKDKDSSMDITLWTTYIIFEIAHNHFISLIYWRKLDVCVDIVFGLYAFIVLMNSFLFSEKNKYRDNSAAKLLGFILLSFTFWSWNFGIQSQSFPTSLVACRQGTLLSTGWSNITQFTLLPKTTKTLKQNQNLKKWLSRSWVFMAMKTTNPKRWKTDEVSPTIYPHLLPSESF